MRGNHRSGMVGGSMNPMTLQQLQQLQSNLQQQSLRNYSSRRVQSEGSNTYTSKKRSLDFMSPTSKDIGSMVQRLSSMPETTGGDMVLDPFEPTPLPPATLKTDFFRRSSAPAAPNQSLMPTNNPAEEEDPFEPLDPNTDCSLDAFVESASLLEWLDEDGSIKSTKKRCTSFSGSNLMQPQKDNRNMGQILEILQQQQRDSQRQKQAKMMLQLEQKRRLEQLRQKQLQEVQERKQKLQQEQKKLLLRKLQKQDFKKEMQLNVENFFEYEVRTEESPTFSTLNQKQEKNGMPVHLGGRLNDSMDQSAKTESMLQNLFSLDSKPTAVTPEPYAI